MPENKQNIHNDLIDAILEKPIQFTIGKHKQFSIYQPSIGVRLLSSQLIEEIQSIQPIVDVNRPQELLRICSEYRPIVLRIIALHTFPRRSDVLKEHNISERIKALETLEEYEIATLFTCIMSWEGRLEQFMKHFNLDREKRTREKIYNSKKRNGGSLTFGGRSIYGALLDVACERYGWELGYVLWGISALNLNMLLLDRVHSVYLSKEEAQMAHISTDGVYLDATDTKNLREIQRMIKANIK